jgi:hypothetical protein
MRIRDSRSLPAIAQEDLRTKAVKAVLEGKKQVEVAITGSMKYFTFHH